MKQINVILILNYLEKKSGGVELLGSELIKKKKPDSISIFLNSCNVAVGYMPRPRCIKALHT